MSAILFVSQNALIYASDSPQVVNQYIGFSLQYNYGAMPRRVLWYFGIVLRCFRDCIIAAKMYVHTSYDVIV